MDSTQASEFSQRRRRRLSRTFSRARWPEYGRLLKAALGAGYEAATLEGFLDGAAGRTAAPVLVLRHDVDQHARSALTMSDIERELGLRSTWYFRWRTADASVIAELRRRGNEVGLHYETLTRDALQGDLGAGDEGERLGAARRRLREEIEAFAAAFGPIRSVAAHGDTRVPGVRNGELLRDQRWADFGVDYDANDALRRHRLDVWLTDRSSAEGGWSGDFDPFSLIGDGATPILCLTHPNNWMSGVALWRHRLLAGILRRDGDAPRV